jgi:hypothetical protein
MTTFEEVHMKITKDDIISSRKGILSESPLTGKFYLWHKAKYLGSGGWQIIGEKEEVDASMVKK